MNVDKFSRENSQYVSLGIVAGYLGLKMEVVKKLHINDLKQLMGELNFLAVPFKQKPIHEFEYKGDRYSILPSMLKGEAQDFITNEGHIEKFKDQPEQALPYVVAVLAKKDGETLDSYDLDKRALHFHDLPITIGKNIYFFFALTEMLYSPDSHKVLQVMDKSLNESLNSMLNTLRMQDGSVWYMRLLRVTLRSYIKSLKRSWKSYYSGYISEAEKQTLIEQFNK